MDANDSALARRADSLVNLSEALCALPAVPTRGWVDQAATCLCEIDERALGVVVLASVQPDGSPHHIDAVGVGTRRANPDQTQRAEMLKAALANLGPIGPCPADDAAPLSDEACAASGLDAAASRVSRRVAATGITRMHPAHPDRVILTALLSPEGGFDDTRATALRAATPLLARRAHLALGAGLRGEGEWLTERERVVLDELTLGKSVRQIADELERSPHTIHDHVKSLHRKLDASSRGELIARALGHISTDGGASLPLAEPKLAPRPAGATPIVEHDRAADRPGVARPMPRVAG